MFQQIISHTPLYVWFILAALIYRGILASTDREMSFGKLLILPVIMPLLALQDIANKFGLNALTLAAWMAGAALAGVVTWGLFANRISASAQPGKWMVRGSWVPLGVMMAVFATKYAAAILLAISPQLRHDTLAIAFLCALFGCFNGIFFGRLARDVGGWQQLRGTAPAALGAA
jgi:hypothetical protein